MKAAVGEMVWGKFFFKVMMKNMMNHIVNENTRYRGDNNPVGLDLVLTREIQIN